MVTFPFTPHLHCSVVTEHTGKTVNPSLSRQSHSEQDFRAAKLELLVWSDIS